MKLIISTLLMIVNFKKYLSDNAGNCEIKGITSYYWRNGYVNNDLISDNSISVNMLGSAEKLVLIKTVGGYLTAIDTGYNSINIQTKNLRELDRDTGTTPGEITAISADFAFNCKSGNSTLTYMVIVRDYNHYSPQFDYKQYEFKIPKTISKDDDITRFGREIIVTDLDFSNKQIDFEIEPLDLFICKTENLGNKKYRAVIKIQNITKIDKDNVYILKATDHGNYPGILSSNVSLKLSLTNSANFDNIASYLNILLLSFLFEMF